MFLRMVSMAVRKEQIHQFSDSYDKNVISVLRTTPGCVFASLLQNVKGNSEGVSLTIWNSHQEAQAYETSGVFKQLVEVLRPFYAESTEYTLQLSEDLSLEYSPVVEEPTVKGYTDSNAERGFVGPAKSTPYVVHIVSLTIEPAKAGEFEHIVTRDILPQYKKEKGFIDLVLLRRERECQILSFWDETVDINTALGEQKLNVLLKEIFRVLPSFVQWKVSHQSSATSSASSDNLKATLYRCLTAEWFIR